MNAGSLLLCSPKIPFVQGGTEALVRCLATNLTSVATKVDTIELPLQEWPQEAILRSASLWRFLDLEQADLVIATKFPSYFVRHSNKVVWLVHQFRQIYDMYDTVYSSLQQPRPDNYQLLKWIVEQDRESLQAARKIYAISENVRKRLRKFLSMDAEVLYPPPPLQGRYSCMDYEPAVLAVQRLEANKRTDLLIRSLQLVRVPFHAWIVGTGSQEGALRSMADELCEKGKITFLGSISNEELLRYYARCRLVFYAPYDEDYGFVPLEAFMSRKPVVTAADSGGPLEFVSHQVSGWIAESNPESLAHGIQMLLEDPSKAEAWGNAGWDRFHHMSWENAIAAFTKFLG